MAQAGSHNCQKQKAEISKLLKTPLRKGDTWYLVDTRWFRQWKRYVGFDSCDANSVGAENAKPGLIDNSALLKAGSDGSCGILKDYLAEESDYITLPERAWQKLVGWYGMVKGQEPLARKVIVKGIWPKHCEVEAYLMDLRLCNSKNPDYIVVKYFSKTTTYGTIEKEMRKLFNIKDGCDVRLLLNKLCTCERLGKMDQTIEDLAFFPGCVIVIEEKNDDGTYGQTNSNSRRRKNAEPVGGGAEIASTPPRKVSRRDETSKAMVTCGDIEHVTSNTESVAATPTKRRGYGEVYKARVWEDLRALFQQDHLTDIMLAAEGQSIPCHRVLLAAASQFFHDKFVTNPESLEHNLLDIEDIDFHTLTSVVSFIYSGDIELTPEKALKLCPASIKLMLPELTGMCEDFLLDQASWNDPDVSLNIDINRMAKENAREDLVIRSWQAMVSEFEEVIKSAAFKEISDTELIEYMDDDGLNIANEDPVFKALVTWVRHDLENRKSSFESLLKHVTLPHCSLEFLRDTVKREPMMMSLGCYEHLTEALCQHATATELKPGTPREGYTPGWSNQT